MNWKRILGIAAVVVLIAALAFGAWRVLSFGRMARAARVVVSTHGFHRGMDDEMFSYQQFHSPHPFASARLRMMQPYGYAHPGGSGLMTGLLVLAGVGLGWYLGRLSIPNVVIEKEMDSEPMEESKPASKKSSKK